MTSSAPQSRKPLAELPLHLYVSQSLDSSSKPPNTLLTEAKTPSRSRSPSLPWSQRNSRSVSPHKQAVLENYRRVREGSVSSTSIVSLQSSASDSESQRTLEFGAASSPRKLFPSQPSSLSDSLEQSNVLPGASLPTQFSPNNVTKAAHHLNSRPTTPSDAKTTPSNQRLHRPSHMTGPKPTNLMEPSPSTQRYSEPRVPHQRRQTEPADPVTPSRPRQLRAASPFEAQQRASSDVSAAANQPSNSSQLLQSLPKKKHRVSRTEIAIAHEEAGSGPTGSPSPCKVANYVLSPKSVSQPAVAWTVFEDPPIIESTNDCPALSEDLSNTAADRQSSPSSSVATNSVPSTPNKENRLPDIDLLASKVVPIALPDRAYSASAVPTSSGPPSRKRGTGGRLSLLAIAGDEPAKAKDNNELAEPSAPLSASKRSRNQDKTAEPDQTTSTRKVSHSRKASASKSPEASRGRRKVSARHAQRDHPDGDQISSRTRSRT